MTSASITHLGRKGHRYTLPAHCLAVSDSYSALGFLRVGILDEGIAPRLATLRPRLVVQIVELGDLAVFGECLYQRVSVHREMSG